MVLLRYLASAALLAGCNQSLFDIGGDGPDDGGPRTDVPDARDDDRDAGMLPRDAAPDQPDAGSGRPDARLEESCPSPCAGDAFAEFDDQQGGPDGWRYIEVQSNGSYVDMAPASFPDAITGWQGTGPDAPTIARCDETSDEPPCVELDTLVALTSSAQAAPRPALIWTASEYGTFIVSGSFRGPSGAFGTEILMTLTRNGEAEQLAYEQATLAAEPHAFDLEVDVVAGDAIVLSARPTTDVSVTVGVNLFFSGPY